MCLSLVLAGCSSEDQSMDSFGTADISGGLETNAVSGVGGDTSDASGEGEGDTGSGPPTSSCGQPISGGGTFAGFNTIILNVGDDEYKVQTNPWGGADQTITAGGQNIFTIDSINHPAGTEPWEVASFPSVYRGMPYGGDGTVDSGMPIAISELNGVLTGVKTNALSMGYQGNTTYDVYFTNSESYAGGSPDVYLMVWLDADGLNPINGAGEGWDCSSNPPTFIDACSGAGETTIDGKKFYRFVGPNGPATVISYVPETRMEEWEFDLNGFIQDAVASGPLTSSMYLQGVQAGFELADAGTGLTIQEFCVDVW